MSRPFLIVLVLLGTLVPPASAAHDRPKTVRFSLAVVNTSDKPSLGVLWAYGPNAQTATQKCVKLDASQLFEKTTDGWGNQALRFDLGEIPPYGRREVVVQADMLLSVGAEKVKTPRALRKAARKPEPFVESADPEIARLAASLKGRNAADSAEKAYKWVGENLVYEGPHAEPRGAKAALERRKGDCTESMYLFIALCRANGVPARGVGGYLTPADRAFRARDYHNWAEFFDGKRWRLADPEHKRFMAAAEDYIAFRVQGAGQGRDFERFRVEGAGLEASMVPAP